MDRWLSVARTSEVERLEGRLLGSQSRIDVPVLRAWGDAVVDVAMRETTTRTKLRGARVDSYVLRVFPQPLPADGVDQILVAAESCMVALGRFLAPLYRGSEWRNVKRAMTEDGVDEGLVEEMFTPTTHDGTLGLANPQGTADYLAGLDPSMRHRVSEYFSSEIDKYLESARSLADIGEEVAIDSNLDVIVPWSAVILLRNAKGDDLVRG